MRKWTYLVATLLMAGTTATFTGCIDTDEPEGIAELRGVCAALQSAGGYIEMRGSFHQKYYRTSNRRRKC